LLHVAAGDRARNARGRYGERFVLRRYLDALRHRAHFHREVDRELVPDAQRDLVQRILPEARVLGDNPIDAGLERGKRVDAGAVRRRRNLDARLRVAVFVLVTLTTAAGTAAPD
jgi:hypothetical protein